MWYKFADQSGGRVGQEQSALCFSKSYTGEREVLQKRTEVGLHESLLPLQQWRPIQMVALVVDPAQRCLMIDGELPMHTHACVGCCTHEGILPFVTKLIEPALKLRQKRVYQVARVYDPFEMPTPRDTLYIVARVDVAESRAVPGGEWVATAERAKVICRDERFIKCAQLFLGDQLAWQTPSASLS